MISMTYGQLPAREAFDAAFERATAIKSGFVVHTMSVNLKGVDARAFERTVELGPASLVAEHGAWPEYNGEWTARETWAAVNDLATLWNAGDEDAGSLASAILTVLGFEWI